MQEYWPDCEFKELTEHSFIKDLQKINIHDIIFHFSESINIIWAIENKHTAMFSGCDVWLKEALCWHRQIVSFFKINNRIHFLMLFWYANILPARRTVMPGNSAHSENLTDTEKKLTSSLENKLLLS